MWKRKKKVTVVVATRNPDALAALEQDEWKIERREALTTEGAYRALDGAHLAVVDLDDLVESADLPREQLASVLSGSDVEAVDGATFAADPVQWLELAQERSGIAGALPTRVAALTGLSGGVGKTTLALSLARYFRKKTRLPVAVCELCAGPSGLLALLGADGAHIYEAATQDLAWPTWEGVTLVPMDWSTARLLPEAQVRDLWAKICQTHTLTVFDVPAYHPLWPIARELTHKAFVVSDGRPDALAAALYLIQEDKHQLLINRGGVAARVQLETPPTAFFPDVGRAAARFPSRLGERMMRVVYPGWRR